MSTAVRCELGADKVAVFTIDQPQSRVNVMSQAVIGDFENALDWLEKQTGVRGLILRSGKPGMFIAGADLKELMQAASLQGGFTGEAIDRGCRLIARIEALPFPTVAAIDGPCMGGGLEVALAFDFRMVSTHPKTELALPETKVGLIPGWGGTQRLPRLVGPSLALEMIASGEGAGAARCVEIGLAFDAVPAEQLLAQAHRLIELAQSAASPKVDIQRIREKKRQPVGLTEEQAGYTFAVAKGQILQKTKGQFPAPLAALDVMQNSVNRTLDEGLLVEKSAFLKIIATPTARNLIAIFFMNQHIQKDTGVSDTSIQPRDIRLVGVVGAGIMGAGIAGAFIRRNVPVMMIDNAPTALEKGVGAIQKVLMSRVQIGRMKPEEVLQAAGRLSTSLHPAALSDRDLVVEAVVENQAVKTKLFQELQAVLRPGTLLASNTSTISITAMAQGVRDPDLFAGLHFFNPVDRMALVEVIRGEKTSDTTVSTLVALAKKIGKSPIVVKDCPGFLVNRVLFPYLNESLVLLEQGADPRELDKAATEFGMPMGPVTLNDVVGLDTSLYAGNVVNTAFADRAVSGTLLADLVKAGRLGQKSGAGFYSYAKDAKKGKDDPALTPFLDRCRKEQRSFTREELRERLFLPMFLEATRVLADGIVREPADVDMGLILGIGFPAQHGGILRWADSVGLKNVLTLLEKYQSLGARYHATDLLRKVSAEGGSFYRV